MKITLKAARINAGYKAKDVAHILGICASRVAQVENGIRPIRTEELDRMCKLYGMSKDEIRLEERSSGRAKIFAV